jgi:hypothetical protein
VVRGSAEPALPSFGPKVVFGLRVDYELGKSFVKVGNTLTGEKKSRGTKSAGVAKRVGDGWG